MVNGLVCLIMTKGSVMASEPRHQQKQYDYLLKFLLVGDSDVGKQEILSGLEDGSSESPFSSGSGKSIWPHPCSDVMQTDNNRRLKVLREVCQDRMTRSRYTEVACLTSIQMVMPHVKPERKLGKNCIGTYIVLAMEKFLETSRYKELPNYR